MTTELEKWSDDASDSPLERIRRTNEAGNEYWSGRDFAEVLGYSEYRNFKQVIQK